MESAETTFCELRNKEIINETDGRRLGKMSDLVFCVKTGVIKGIIAPFNRKALFFKAQEVFIPFKNIVKIGPDVILVKLTPELSDSPCVKVGEDCKPADEEGDKCDRRCEKCMLFDCADRWKRDKSQNSVYVDGKLYN